jgi:hypothetical protein
MQFGSFASLLKGRRGTSVPSASAIQRCNCFAIQGKRVTSPASTTWPSAAREREQAHLIDRSGVPPVPRRQPTHDDLAPTT